MSSFENKGQEPPEHYWKKEFFEKEKNSFEKYE